MTPTTHTLANPNPRVQWLNVLRGLCSVWIIYYHLYTPYAVGLKGSLPHIDANLISAFYSRHISLGASGFFASLATAHDLIATMSLHAVGVFIFMSGFGVTASLLRRADRGVLSWPQWFRERFFRLYPFLWFAHLLYLFAPFVWKTERVDWRFLISLTGIRAWPMDMIIYYANSSWWFFWLIIQLYFALPILFWLLRKSGIAWFSAITVAVTLLARYWMLYHERSNLAGYMLIGGVFVSRLAEFSLGMAFASLAHEKGTHVLHAIGSNSATLLGAALYIGGTLCYSANSTYIFVDLLCTAGMVLLSARVAMFLCWIAPVRKALTFAGSVSLSTFLLHQPWAISIGLALHKQPAWLFGLCSAIAIPVLIAISWICERAVNWVVDLVRRTDRRPAAATPEAA